jgi:DNA-directed RNA polymerase subunit RPC12/RpoP
MKDITRHSVLTCPHCGFAGREEMPIDACQIFYDCARCGARLQPKNGDCCVFCSFGSNPCPSRQADRSVHR